MEKVSLKEIKQILKQRCKYEDNRALNNIERFFYTLKVLICILLKRQKSLYTDPDSLCVAILNFRNAYSLDVMNGYDWEEIAVGYGLFENWHYDRYDNSSY